MEIDLSKQVAEKLDRSTAGLSSSPGSLGNKKGEQVPGETRAPEYLTPQALAAMMSVSLKFIIKQTQARRIPGQIKVGRIWRYKRSEVEKRVLSGHFLLPARGKG